LRFCSWRIIWRRRDRDWVRWGRFLIRSSWVSGRYSRTSGL
jgi:hypothetical protein